MNPLLQALQSKNPLEYLQNLAQHNPQIANVLNMYNQFTSATPQQQEQFIQQFCQQRGINIDDVKRQYEQFIGGLRK